MDIGELTGEVIGAAIEVHKTLGPGLLESTYEECLCRELELRKISYERQKGLPIEYKGLKSLGVLFPAACREFVIPAKAGIQKIRLDSVSSTE